MQLRINFNSLFLNFIGDYFITKKLKNKYYSFHCTRTRYRWTRKMLYNWLRHRQEVHNHGSSFHPRLNFLVLKKSTSMFSQLRIIIAQFYCIFLRKMGLLFLFILLRYLQNICKYNVELKQDSFSGCWFLLQKGIKNFFPFNDLKSIKQVHASKKLIKTLINYLIKKLYILYTIFIAEKSLTFLKFQQREKQFRGV